MKPQGVSIYIVWAALLFLVFPSALLAATPPPEFNPVCWKKADCLSMRAKLQNKVVDEVSNNTKEKEDLENGFIQGAEPCTGEWGKCLPANVTVTSIAIGGKTRFNNVGDYIQTVYTYVLGIVGILSSFMIVLAGLQWAVAGGNAESISSAKHRMVNALVGMFLAYSSYTLLSFINPALVNLRLPQVYLLRPQDVTPEFCSAAPAKTAFAFAAPATNQKGPVNVQLQSAQFKSYFMKSAPAGKTTPDPVWTGIGTDISDSYNDDNFFCGSRLYMQGGSSVTCFGDVCGGGFLCMNLASADDNQPNYTCVPGLMGGKVGGDIALEAQSGIVIDNDLQLMAFCKNGSSQKVQSVNVTNSTKPGTYLFTVSKDDALGACKGVGNIIGFYLLAEVNDETGGPTGDINKIGLGIFTTFSWGVDDWHIIGQEFKGSHDCSVNLARVGNAILNRFTPCSVRRNLGGCSAGFIANTPDASNKNTAIGLDLLTTNETFVNHLISVDELKRGFMCNLDINRAEFPAMTHDDPSGLDTIPKTNPNGINAGDNSFINK